MDALRPEQNGCLVAHNILNCILLKDNVCIEILWIFLPIGQIDEKLVLVQVMVWHFTSQTMVFDAVWHD